MDFQQKVENQRFYQTAMSDIRNFEKLKKIKKSYFSKMEKFSKFPKNGIYVKELPVRCICVQNFKQIS